MTKKTYFIFLSFFSFLIVLEGFSTFLYQKGIIEPYGLWTHEKTDSKGNIRFEFKKGIEISKKKSRIAYWTSKTGYYSISDFKGNNWGFLDKKDFISEKIRKRALILGDSMTAGIYLNNTWPEIVEKRLLDLGRDVEIYNLSYDGIGLANWWRILNYIEERKLDYDFIVFAICCNDLNRTHFWWSDNIAKNKLGNRFYASILHSESFDPNSFESPFENPGYRVLKWPILTVDEFNKYVTNNIKPPYDREKTFYIYETLKNLFNKKHERKIASNGDYYKEKLIKEIRSKIKKPIYIVKVSSNIEYVESFEKLILPKEVVDVRSAFKSNDGEILLPLDKHFNQKGANIVGNYLVRSFDKWFSNLE